MREIVFGLEDSIVSTLGAVTGIAAGTHSADLVLLSGLVIVVVEAVSMAAGSYLSTKSEYELMGVSGRKHSPARAAWVMFYFYVLGGIVPLIPYVFLNLWSALCVAIVFSSIALFSLGYWKGIVVKKPPLRSGVEMMTVSLFAAAVGYIVGGLAPHLINIIR